MGKIVGIDLGTTNSLVAYLDPPTKQPKCIVGPHGSTLCPSIKVLIRTEILLLASRLADGC